MSSYDSQANRQFLKSHGLMDGIARRDDRNRYDQSGIHKRNARLGRIRARLALNSMGIVDSPLPVALPPTLYARFGDLIFLLFLVTAVALAFVLGRKTDA